MDTALSWLCLSGVCPGALAGVRFPFQGWFIGITVESHTLGGRASNQASMNRPGQAIAMVAAMSLPRHSRVFSRLFRP
ncbi:hypothetical protein ACRQF5_09435, partial [Actinotignum sp. GS-2025b]|uniref:hypothetical protein n=2 Tax=Actinotignum sp. GS-2025b TaxID=3427275 RepID=UPI003F479A00